MSSRDSDSQPVMTFVVFVVLMLLIMSIITGCSTTVPVAAKFPNPPDKMGGAAMTACPQLKQLEADPKLSDVSKTITVNYGTYYECAIKLDTWIEWYAIQKKIFEKVGQ